MKIKKMLVLISIICIIMIATSTPVFAVVPHYSYNTTNIIISKIMKLAIIHILIAYVIFFIIYLKESNIKKDKKIKKLSLWFFITIFISIGLWIGSKLIFEAGSTYTSSPSDNFWLPVIERK